MRIVTGTATPAHHALPAVRILAPTKQDPLPGAPSSRTLPWPSSAHRTKVASPSGRGRLSCPASRSAGWTRASRARI